MQRRLLPARATWFLALLAAVIIGIALGRETLRDYQIEKEIRDLESQAEELAEGNRELEQLVRYLETEDYAEKEARLRLNLQREGEQVVIVPEAEEGDHPLDENEKSETVKTNQEKWLKYFFDYP